MRLRLPLCVTFVALALTLAVRAQGDAAYLTADGSGYAVDAKGRRHDPTDVRSSHQSWLKDLTQAFAPEYPFRDRNLGHEGRGMFRLLLDLKTGGVSKVGVIKSTGYPTLDEAAVVSLHRFRWKPGLWREIVMPVTFTMKPGDWRSHPDGKRLPRENEENGSLYRLESKQKDIPR